MPCLSPSSTLAEQPDGGARRGRVDDDPLRRRPERAEITPPKEGEEAASLVVALDRGVEVDLRIQGETDFGPEQQQGHLLFLLEESQRSLVSGPFPRQGGPSNNRINGVNMWLSEPGLIEQLVGFENGAAFMSGLAPGRYSIVAFPDSYRFEPEVFSILEPDGSSIAIRWSSK